MPPAVAGYYAVLAVLLFSEEKSGYNKLQSLIPSVLPLTLTQNAPQYSLHNVTDAHAMFEVASSNGLGCR